MTKEARQKGQVYGVYTLLFCLFCSIITDWVVFPGGRGKVVLGVYYSLQGNKSGLSWPVSFQGKALLAANGRRPLQEEHQPTGVDWEREATPKGWNTGMYSINAAMPWTLTGQLSPDLLP